MSALSSLEIHHFRNISSLSLEPAPSINLIYGANGSGKTSLLESIHVLATGKSFRSHLVDPLIQDDSTEATVFARAADGSTFGLRKPRNKKHDLKLNGANQSNWDDVIRALPVQVLDASSFQLLEGGPKARRRFLDWGVFHVEPQFVSAWRRSRKALANRNRLLKFQRLDEDQLAPWDQELSLAAETINEARTAYIDKLLPNFEEIYQELGGDSVGLTISYEKGWDEEIPLLEALAAHRTQDHKYGSSQIGPHRADIEIKVGKRKAVEILSRGQQKILICALKIAQGKLLSESMGRQCYYLVDDLPAELDQQNRERVLTKLTGLGGQLFVTAVDKTALNFDVFDAVEIATFHVERGTIRD